MLMGSNEEHEIVVAASELIPYLKSEVKLKSSHETLSMEELVDNFFKIVSSSVT